MNSAVVFFNHCSEFNNGLGNDSYVGWWWVIGRDDILYAFSIDSANSRHYFEAEEGKNPVNDFVKWKMIDKEVFFEKLTNEQRDIILFNLDLF